MEKERRLLQRMEIQLEGEIMVTKFVYICPVDGKDFESDKLLTEDTPCPEHPESVLKFEGSFEE